MVASSINFLASTSKVLARTCVQVGTRRGLPVSVVCPHRVVRRALSMSATAGKEVISTEKAPGAVGPYSQAIKHGGTLYVSGQVPMVPGTKDLVGDGIEEQTEQVMKNIGAILEAAGTSFDKVLKATVLIMDMGDFAKVNAVYGKYFPKDPPARLCYAVKTLPVGAKVEIECIAAL